MPTGSGKPVTPLVVKDILAHDRSFYSREVAYDQLLSLAFFLKRRMEHESGRGSRSFSELRSSIVEDVEARSREGEKKYGTVLRTNNGRDALIDAYQEILDGLQYLRQSMEESLA